MPAMEEGGEVYLGGVYAKHLLFVNASPVRLFKKDYIEYNFHVVESKGKTGVDVIPFGWFDGDY